MEIKRIIIGALVFLGVVIGVKAIKHTRMSTDDKVKHITEKMAKKLSLTPEQKEKVYKINLERANGHELAYKEGRDREVLMKAVNQWKEGLQQVLSEEQAKKLNL